MWKRPYVTSTETARDFIVELFGNMIVNRYVYLLQNLWKHCMGLESSFNIDYFIHSYNILILKQN